jgi:FkbM family methyltransferase
LEVELTEQQSNEQLEVLQTLLENQLTSYQDLWTHVTASRWIKFGQMLGITQINQAIARAPHPDMLKAIISEQANKAIFSIEQTLSEQAPARPEAFTMESTLFHLAKRGLKPKVILDVGAFKGYWSEYAQYFFPDANFYMIDPLKVNEARLQELCQKDTHFAYLRCAVGDVEGELIMNVTDDVAGSSLLAFDRDRLPQDEKVKIRTLDNLIAEGAILPPQLVKMDVQGYELKALDGGQRLFETTDVFILEVSMFEFMSEHPLAHQVIDYMAKRGYFLFDIAGYLRRPFENDLGQLDLVFAKDTSPLRSSNRWM